MIKIDRCFASELLVKFKVLNVTWEPHSESTWLLQYQECEPFKIYEQGFYTIEEDELLVGKEIEAQIDISVDDILPATEKLKSFVYRKGNVIVTGIYQDIILSEINGKIYTEYKLDSLFPLSISKIPAGAQIGDWLTVEGEATLVLPRERK